MTHSRLFSDHVEVAVVTFLIQHLLIIVVVVAFFRQTRQTTTMIHNTRQVMTHSWQVVYYSTCSRSWVTKMALIAEQQVIYKTEWPFSGHFMRLTLRHVIVTNTLLVMYLTWSMRITSQPTNWLHACRTASNTRHNCTRLIKHARWRYCRTWVKWTHRIWQPHCHYDILLIWVLLCTNHHTCLTSWRPQYAKWYYTDKTIIYKCKKNKLTVVFF